MGASRDKPIVKNKLVRHPKRLCAHRLKLQPLKKRCHQVGLSRLMNQSSTVFVIVCSLATNLSQGAQNATQQQWAEGDTTPRVQFRIQTSVVLLC